MPKSQVVIPVLFTLGFVILGFLVSWLFWALAVGAALVLAQNVLQIRRQGEPPSA